MEQSTSLLSFSLLPSISSSFSLFLCLSSPCSHKSRDRPAISMDYVHSGAILQCNREPEGCGYLPGNFVSPTTLSPCPVNFQGSGRLSFHPAHFALGINFFFYVFLFFLFFYLDEQQHIFARQVVTGNERWKNSIRLSKVRKMNRNKIVE